MSIHAQSLQNNMLSSLTERAGAKIAGSIERASHKTGVDFAYLMQQAGAESSFQAEAKAKTSSATGLFQFIDRTWLSMVERYGEKYGVDTTQPKQDLLALRKDPELSSYMAGELAKENESVLQSLLGEDAQIGSTELYFAHFMGPARAAGFLSAHSENANLRGADLFPKEAQANKAVFFDQNQRPKTLAEIYDRFDDKFSIENAERRPIEIAAAPTTSQKEIVQKDYVPQYLPADPLGSIQRMDTMLDLLAPSSPVMRKQDSSISSLSYFMKAQYGLGNLLQSPTDVMWLSALEDDLLS